MIERPRCKTCIFFVGEPNPPAYGGYKGDCLRFPPVFSSYSNTWRRPVVWSHESCGEHELPEVVLRWKL